MMPLLVATANRGKVSEFRQLLDIPGLVLRSFLDLATPPDVVEDGTTFFENALRKALAGFAVGGTPTLADDSGLCVPALGGEPGIHSARYGGVPGDSTRNMARLLYELASQPEGAARRAYFECTLVLLGPAELLGPDTLGAAARPATLDPRLSLHVFTGRVDGRLLRAPRGRGGFGYDPLFVADAYPDRTFAELPSHLKDRVSHRGQAAAALRQFLADRLGATPPVP